MVEYYEYNSEVSLTWLWLDNQRKSLLKFIQTDSLAALTGLTLPEAQLNEIIRHFIKDAPSLISLIKNLPVAYRVYLINSTSEFRIASLIQTSDSVRLFQELLDYLPAPIKRKQFLEACGDEFVKKMLYQGLRSGDVRTVMPGLAIVYSEGDYVASKSEALSVSKGLIRQLIDSEFKQFNHINFVKLPYPYLEHINFSDLNLQRFKIFSNS